MANEQLTAEQVRDLLHEVAGMLGIRLIGKDDYIMSLGDVWIRYGNMLLDSDIDSINEGRVVDAFNTGTEPLLFERTPMGRWCARIGFGSEWCFADSRLVAVLLAARAALKAEEAA